MHISPHLSLSRSVSGSRSCSLSVSRPSDEFALATKPGTQHKECVASVSAPSMRQPAKPSEPSLKLAGSDT